MLSTSVATSPLSRAVRIPVPLLRLPRRRARAWRCSLTVGVGSAALGNAGDGAPGTCYYYEASKYPTGAWRGIGVHRWRLDPAMRHAAAQPPSPAPSSRAPAAGAPAGPGRPRTRAGHER
ncbi:hypothetical protein FAIPA1_50024 [Frankia sp. AiPs1]